MPLGIFENNLRIFWNSEVHFPGCSLRHYVGWYFGSAKKMALRILRDNLLFSLHCDVRIFACDDFYVSGHEYCSKMMSRLQGRHLFEPHVFRFPWDNQVTRWQKIQNTSWKCVVIFVFVYLSDGLVVVGVHSAKFPNEKVSVFIARHYFYFLKDLYYCSFCISIAKRCKIIHKLEHCWSKK